MANLTSSSYEPYRHHEDGDEDNAEKPLVRDRNTQPYTKHQKNPRRFQPFRIALQILAILIAVSILGVQVHSVSTWLSTRHVMTRNSMTGLRTSAWAFIDAGPTWTMISAAAFTVVVDSISILTRCSGWHRHESPWHARGIYLSSGAVIVFWLATVVYFKVVDAQGTKKDHWDLWSWTCHRKGQSGNIPWETLCTENYYTFVVSVIMVLVEIIGLAVFFCG